MRTPGREQNEDLKSQEEEPVRFLKRLQFLGDALLIGLVDRDEIGQCAHFGLQVRQRIVLERRRAAVAGDGRGRHGQSRPGRGEGPEEYRSGAQNVGGREMMRICSEEQIR